MSVLKGYKPENVLHIFEQLCAIPHGSGNTKAISDWCVGFAKERGLACRQDELNNVLIVKEATPGYEQAETVIIQGHLDMVCDKTADYPIDFMRDGLKLGVDGDWIYAEGTTLGGDDGIAVAMALAILDAKDVSHPRIEALFTIDEETGMEGAQGLDVSWLQGRKLLNLDSEDEGILTVSCAGGLRVDCTLPVRREQMTAVCGKLTVGGLKGGHSGAEIDKGRGNSNRMMGRLLYAMQKCAPFAIADMAGGSKDNAIPLLTTADIMASAEDMRKLQAVAQEYDAIYKHEYATADSGVYVTLEVSGEKTEKATDVDSTDRMIFTLLNVPGGIQAMSMDIKDLVQTSLNLGVLYMEEDAMRFSFSVRSSVATQKMATADRVCSVVSRMGGSAVLRGDYPAWEYKRDSALRETVVASYQRLFGKEPEVAAIHAGLECGLFSGKLPGLDCISFGPQMHNVHTSNERLSISSVERTYDFVLDILKHSK